MANPERGEVDLEVGDTRYRLALGMGGLRAIQAAVSTPGHRVTLWEVVQGATNGDIEYLSVMVWGALQRHHPEVTQAGADTIIDQLGGLQAIPQVVALITEMMTATTPDARDQGALKKTNAHARTPAAGPAGTISTTGTRSTSRREKLA
jgi:hypothetical protein